MEPKSNQKLYDFYYSDEQKKHQERCRFQLSFQDKWPNSPGSTKTIQGKEYTECVPTGQAPLGRWEDMKLVATAPLP